MQPQENPCRVLLGLHGNSTERFLIKNLICLECTADYQMFLFLNTFVVSMYNGQNNVVGIYAILAISYFEH